MENHFIGTWIYVENPDKPDQNKTTNVKIVSVNGTTALTDKGKEISVFDLESSGKYAKKGNPYSNDVLSGFSEYIQPKIVDTPVHNPSPVLIEQKPINTVHESIHQNSDNQRLNDLILNDPETSMVNSAIELSKSKGESSKLTVELTFPANFNIQKIITLAEGVGADENNTLELIISKLDLSENNVRKLIIDYVLSLIKSEEVEEPTITAGPINTDLFVANQISYDQHTKTILDEHNSLSEELNPNNFSHGSGYPIDTLIEDPKIPSIGSIKLPNLGNLFGNKNKSMAQAVDKLDQEHGHTSS